VERFGVTLNGGAGGANTYVSEERKFLPLSAVHILWYLPQHKFEPVFLQAPITS